MACALPQQGAPAGALIDVIGIRHLAPVGGQLDGFCSCHNPSSGGLFVSTFPLTFSPVPGPEVKGNPTLPCPSEFVVCNIFVYTSISRTSH